MSLFYAVNTNPVWSCLSQADLLVCLVLRWSLTLSSTGGLFHSVCGGFGGVIEDRDMSDACSLDSLYMFLSETGVCVCGSCVVDGCVV